MTAQKPAVRLILNRIMQPAAEAVRRGDATVLRTVLRNYLPTVDKRGREELVATLALVAVSLASELTDEQRDNLRAGAAPTLLNTHVRSVLLALDLDAARRDDREQSA